MSKLIPIEELLLPKRVLETLKKTGIMTIEDLKCISDEDLYSLPGIGRKSVREIKEILKFYDINIKSVNTNAKPADKNIITEKFHIRKHFNHNINFILAYISDFIESKLKEREKEILARRLLYSQSLQEIGNYFGITRERVRQLEDKLLQKIHILLNPQDLLQHNIILIDKKELPEE
ncbi:DNA-directed RNA polymerase subunit alpha C-terminal domain-containing protein, partial [Persephonella sp.]